jgi:hypothetical protein
MLPWPRVTLQEVEAFVTGATRRADAVARRLMEQGLKGWPKRLGAKLSWRMIARGAVEEAIRYTLLKELHLRNQLQGPSAQLDDDGRKVLAALHDIAYDARTVAGIATEYGLDQARVTELLEKSVGIRSLVEAGPELGSWCLRKRRRGLFAPIFNGQPTIG